MNATATNPVSSEHVNTKRVKGRRTVRYESFDELMNDAEQLASKPVQTLGNWSLGQILAHLAGSIDGMIDGLDFKLPAPLRFGMNLLMKNRMLNKGLPPGFKAPKTPSLSPGPTSTEDGLELLRKAVARAKTENQRAFHPAFGNLTTEEWDRFQLRHCELHMSFVKPN